METEQDTLSQDTSLSDNHFLQSTFAKTRMKLLLCLGRLDALYMRIYLDKMILFHAEPNSIPLIEYIICKLLERIDELMYVYVNSITKSIEMSKMKVLILSKAISSVLPHIRILHTQGTINIKLKQML
ncbi:hypothetical protein JTB14_024506 [Gonioctena quinquepunctata]|nr:hypothetical protein JTB14_024506 [Gonioctena quinquepunctata]